MDESLDFGTENSEPKRHFCAKDETPDLDESVGFGTERSAPRSHLFSLLFFKSYGFLNHAASLALLESADADLPEGGLFDDELVDAAPVDELESAGPLGGLLGFIRLSPQAQKHSCHAASSA